MSKNKRSPKNAVKGIKKTLKVSGVPVRMTDLMGDRIWNDLVQAGYVKARYAFYVGAGTIRNHFIE